METKICSGICGQEKLLKFFTFRADRENYISECKNCAAQKRKAYYKRNRANIISKNLEYQKNNPNIKQKSSRKYRAKNKEKQKQYYANNKIKIYENHIYYQNNKIKTDISFKIKQSISHSIRYGLVKNKFSKKNKSSWNYLPYNHAMLKTHIEKQFEYWMNWENWGSYNSRTWDDNDPSTWKWQLDHIIPHSTFHYENMECEEFRKCWDLSNLRPYSAKQNQNDGATKIRHLGKNNGY